MLLMVLADFVIEKVLLIGERLATTNVFQKKQSKSGGYNITIERYQFNGWLASIVYRERIVAFVLVGRILEMKL